MLGEQVGEERGKVTGIRVLPSEGQSPKIEVSFQASGKFLGLDTTTMGTYQAVFGAGGLLNGEGQGILMTADGEMATWIGHGVGTPTGKGQAVSWRGSLFYQTSSPKLERLSSVAVVFEYETDEDGNTHAKVWEWK